MDGNKKHEIGYNVGELVEQAAKRRKLFERFYWFIAIPWMIGVFFLGSAFARGVIELVRLFWKYVVVGLWLVVFAGLTANAQTQFAALPVTVVNSGTNNLQVGQATTFGVSLGFGTPIAPGGQQVVNAGFQGSAPPNYQNVYIAYTRPGSGNVRCAYVGQAYFNTGAAAPMQTMSLSDQSPCSYPIALSNPGAFEATFMAEVNGTPTGQAFVVEPGASITVIATDPSCGVPGIQLVRVIGGSVQGAGGTPIGGGANGLGAPSSGGGGYNLPPGGLTLGPGTGVGGLTTGAAGGAGGGSDTPLSPTNAPVGTNQFAPPVVIGPPPALAPTNQPIQGTGAYTNNSPAQNGTILAVGNAQAAIDQQGLQAVVDAIKSADTAARQKTNFGSQSISNNISLTNNVTVTNLGGGGSTNGGNIGDYTNVLNQIKTNTSPISDMASNMASVALNTSASNELAVAQTNQISLSNQLGVATSAMMGATNVAGALAGGDLVTAVGGLSTTLGYASGSASATYDVTLTSGALSVVIPIRPYTGPAVAIVHDLITWLCYILLFITDYQMFVVGLRVALTAPQARTAGEELLGTNVNFASALTVGALIIAAIAVIPVFGITVLVNALANVGGSPLAGLVGQQGWGWFCAAVPFDVMMSTAVAHVIFRISLDSIVAVVCGIVRLLVGL